MATMLAMSTLRPQMMRRTLLRLPACSCPSSTRPHTAPATLMTSSTLVTIMPVLQVLL